MLAKVLCSLYRNMHNKTQTINLYGFPITNYIIDIILKRNYNVQNSFFKSRKKIIMQKTKSGTTLSAAKKYISKKFDADI